MLKTVTFQTTIPLDRTLTVQLPADVPTGAAEIVLVISSFSVEPVAPSQGVQPALEANTQQFDDTYSTATVDPATIDAFGDTDSYAAPSNDQPQFVKPDDDVFYP